VCVLDSVCVSSPVSLSYCSALLTFIADTRHVCLMLLYALYYFTNRTKSLLRWVALLVLNQLSKLKQAVVVSLHSRLVYLCTTV
jgi:hypothetical protein